MKTINPDEVRTQIAQQPMVRNSPFLNSFNNKFSLKNVRTAPAKIEAKGSPRHLQQLERENSICSAPVGTDQALPQLHPGAAAGGGIPLGGTGPDLIQPPIVRKSTFFKYLITNVLHRMQPTSPVNRPISTPAPPVVPRPGGPATGFK